MKYLVCAVDELSPGQRKLVEVGGVSIGVFNLNGEYVALRNRCPHQGGPLCEGKQWGTLESTRPGEFSYRADGETLACPWHGWEFHLRTGQSWCDPRRLRARRYPVSVEPASTVVVEEAPPAAGLVKGPYVAETFPVRTEGAYVVVEIPTPAVG
jgi:nitrite reductase/ring-hydroxylating ferredoxin subunit